MKPNKPAPSLRDRVEVDIPGKGIVTGEVRGKCYANGIDLIDVMLDDKERTIVCDIPAGNVKKVLPVKVAA
jgi:hypothetical protein